MALQGSSHLDLGQLPRHDLEDLVLFIVGAAKSSAPVVVKGLQIGSPISIMQQIGSARGS